MFQCSSLISVNNVCLNLVTLPKSKKHFISKADFSYIVQSFALYDCHKKDILNVTSELRSLVGTLWSKEFLLTLFDVTKK